MRGGGQTEGVGYSDMSVSDLKGSRLCTELCRSSLERGMADSYLLFPCDFLQSDFLAALQLLPRLRGNVVRSCDSGQDGGGAAMGYDAWQEPVEVQSTAEDLREATMAWTRIEILVALAETKGRLSVGQLAERLGYELTHVSQHLRKLLHNGLLEYARQGKERLYTLSPRCHVSRASPSAPLLVHFEATDGSTLDWSIAPSSPCMRLINGRLPGRAIDFSPSMHRSTPHAVASKEFNGAAHSSGPGRFEIRRAQ